MKAPAPHTPTPRYYWKQCYQIGDSVHWALCDDESQKHGMVSCYYMVLFADYPTCMDGKPLSEQEMPKRVVAALNAHAELVAALEEIVERDLGYFNGHVLGGQISANSIARARAALAKARLEDDK